MQFKVNIKCQLCMIILEWLPKDYVVMKNPQSHCQILYWCSRPWVLPGAWQCLASNGQGLKAVSGWRKALMPLASCSLDPNPMENLRDIIIGALQVFFLHLFAVWFWIQPTVGWWFLAFTDHSVLIECYIQWFSTWLFCSSRSNV